MSGDVTVGYLKKLSALSEAPANGTNGTLIAGQNYFNVFFIGGTIDGVDIGFNDPPEAIFDSIGVLTEADIAELFVSDGGSLAGGFEINDGITIDDIYMSGLLEIGTFLIDSLDSPETATGTNQATAYPIICDITNFTTVTLGSGAALPNGSPGLRCRIYNSGINALKVYPNLGSGGTIDGGSANASVTLSTTSRGADFIAIDQDIWISNVIGATST